MTKNQVEKKLFLYFWEGIVEGVCKIQIFRVWLEKTVSTWPGEELRSLNVNQPVEPLYLELQRSNEHLSYQVDFSVNTIYR